MGVDLSFRCLLNKLFISGKLDVFNVYASQYTRKAMQTKNIIHIIRSLCISSIVVASSIYHYKPIRIYVENLYFRLSMRFKKK